MPSAHRRPKPAAKSRKNLSKQPSSSGGRSQQQPVASTPLPAGSLLFGNQSNAEFSFTSGTLFARESSLPTAPVTLGNQSKAPFSFASGTVPMGKSSLQTAPVAFGNQSDAQLSFTSNTMPAARESSLPTASVTFGNQSNAQFSFNSGTSPVAEGGFVLPTGPVAFENQANAQFSFISVKVPAEGSSLPAAPPVFGSQSSTQSQPNFGTEPQEESIEKMIADMEAELAKSPGSSENTHIPHDPNYGLDMTFGLDTALTPATPNSGKDSNVTQYSDPSVPDSGCSLTYFAQDSNISDLDWPHISFSQDSSSVPSLELAHDPDAQDPRFDQKLNFPLDPSFDLAIEHSNCEPFAASTLPPEPSATQYPDPNVPDNTHSLPFFIQDSSIRDPVLPCTKSSQHSKSAIDPSFVPNPNVDQNLVAQDSHLKQESRIPLDSNLGLANELDDSKQFAQRTLPSATSVTQHPDPNVQNPAGCLSYSVQDSNMQDPELPHPNSSQDLKSAVDPRFIVNFDVARDLVAQGSSSYEEPSFALHSNLDHTNLNPTAISNALPGPAFAQDPNLPDHGSFMPILVQDSDLQDQKLLRPNLSQEPKSTIDSAFLPNLNVAQDPVIQDSNFHQKPRFPLDPNLSYANEHGNFKSIAAFHAPKALSFAQNPNVPDLVSVLPKFVQSSTAQDPGLALSNFSQDLKSAVDPSSLPNLTVARDTVDQHLTFQQEPGFPLNPNLGLADGRGKSKPAAASNAHSAPEVVQAANVLNPDRFPPDFAQDPYTQAQQMPLTKFFKDSMSVVDAASSFVPNLGIAQKAVAQDSSFSLNNNVGLATERSNFQSMTVPTAPTLDLNQPQSTNFDYQAHNKELRSNSEFQINLSDQSRAFDIDRNKFQQSQSVKTQGFLQSPSTGSGQNVNGLEDSQFDLMDTEPDYKITPPNWKHNNLTQDAFSTVRPGGIQEHSTDRNTVSTSRPMTIEQREIRKLRAEIEHKSKEISDRDERIRRSTQELQDMDKNNMHLISQFRGDLANLRIEKLTLEKANHSLARENSEAKAIQGKAEKDTELIRKLNCELGRIRKKQSMLEKANESLANDYSKSKVDSDTLRQSNINLKEENRHLRASIADLRPFNSELIQAKETIRAQKAEIQDSVQRIAALNSCIDKISPELLWRTEQLQEAEECVFHEESVSKYYRDRCCLLWNKCNALESAGNSRETEFAELELEKEQRHTKEREALIFRIGELQAKNKQPAQRAGDVGVGINVEQADKVAEKVTDIYKYGWSGFTNEIETQIQEPSLPKGHLDDNQKLSKLDEEVGNPISYATAADIILAVEECTAVTAGTTEDSQKRKDQGNLRWGKGF